MAKTETIRARIDPQLKREAESILKALGLSPADAIRLFYRRVTLRRGLPFAVESPMPRRSRPCARRSMARTSPSGPILTPSGAPVADAAAHDHQAVRA
jgi:addiction module RelB/DinJ family antitoxin